MTTNSGASTPFSWPSQPTSEADFDKLMAAIDSVLAAEGFTTFQRPMHLGRKFWEAFKWSGNIFPAEELASRPGFSGDVLMAKAHRWYETNYGDALKSDNAYGFAPFRLGNHIWKVRAGLSYGRVVYFVDRNLQNEGVSLGARAPATRNVLCEIDRFPPGLASSLPDAGLAAFADFYHFMLQSLSWRDRLPDTPLLSTARADYDESTASVLGGRYSQARWAAQQAIEKTFKGLLTIAGTTFPTGGANGHNLGHIAGILNHTHGIGISSALLTLAACSPRVRYAEEASSEKQALDANHAVLGVLEQLRNSAGTKRILSASQQTP